MAERKASKNSGSLNIDGKFNFLSRHMNSFTRNHVDLMDRTSGYCVQLPG